MALKLETETTGAICFKKRDRLSETNIRRLVNPVIWRMKSTLLPKDTRNILATAVYASRHQ